MMPKYHPLRIVDLGRRSNIPESVALRAYEVYCHIYGAQPEMVENGCCGGFGAGELLAYLYARSFPKEEWRQRTDEALRCPEDGSNGR
jgi:hypothetical protein